jgi:anti-sigma factor ChrR (cupin superfamily)
VTDQINADLAVRACADTHRMRWIPSPSGSVLRKRVHLVGPAESGQVTSVVRYPPGATFPAHDHPGGEEILVLDGVFSDEHGDWPAGTYLLNPEGFHHAPYSDPGCLLFVKLRQYPGRNRRHVALNSHDLDWEAADTPGVALRKLYQQPGFADRTVLERWAPGTDRGSLTHRSGVEIFVLDGSFVDEAGRHGAGCWLRLPVGGGHHPRSTEGCTLYVKTAGFAYLHSGDTGDDRGR